MRHPYDDENFYRIRAWYAGIVVSKSDDSVDFLSSEEIIKWLEFICGHIPNIPVGDGQARRIDAINYIVLAALSYLDIAEINHIMSNFDFDRFEYGGDNFINELSRLGTIRELMILHEKLTVPQLSFITIGLESRGVEVSESVCEAVLLSKEASDHLKAQIRNILRSNGGSSAATGLLLDKKSSVIYPEHVGFKQRLQNRFGI